MTPEAKRISVLGSIGVLGFPWPLWQLPQPFGILVPSLCALLDACEKTNGGIKTILNDIIISAMHIHVIFLFKVVELPHFKGSV